MLPQRQPLDQNSPESGRLSRTADRILVSQPNASSHWLISRKLRQRFSHVTKRWRLVLIRNRPGTVAANGIPHGRFDLGPRCASFERVTPGMIGAHGFVRDT